MGRRPSTKVATDRDALGIRWNGPAIPGLVLLTCGFLAPVGMLVVFSLLHDGSYGQVHGPATFKNYTSILSDGFYLGVLLRTLVLGAIVTLFCALLAYPLAYFLAHASSRWRGLLTFLVIMPLMISSVIRNIGWLPILSNNGAVNVLFRQLGLIDRSLPLMNNATGVVIALVHALVPFMTLMLVTVMRAVRSEVEEAARTLGASPWRCFWEIVFPLSLRGLGAGCALVFSIAVSSYTTPMVLGGGKVLVMSTFIAQQIQSVLHYAFGAAFTMILFVISLTLAATASKWLERGA